MRVAPLTGKARRAVALATADVNVWEGSVRSGKTVSSLLAWMQFVRTGPAGNLLMTGKTERTLRRNIIDPIVEMLGPNRVQINSGAGELTLFDRKIYLAGANDERSQDKIRGLTLAGAYIDEASTAPESFWAMLLTRMSVEGARLYATTNPEGPRHWLKVDYLDRACLHLTGPGDLRKKPIDPDDDTNRGPTNLHRFSFRLTDNPNLPPGYVDAMMRQFTGLWRRRYIDGDWVAADGAIYETFDPDIHVVDALPPIVRWLACGVDYGTTNPFAALMVGVGADNRLYVVSEYRYDSTYTRRTKTDGEYSQDMLGWLGKIRVPHSKPAVYGVHPQWLCVDPSAASFVAQMYRDGLTPTPARNSVNDGIRQVAMLLAADRLRVHRSCTGLIDEIPGYVWDPKKTEDGIDAPLKADDHSCDALRYAIATTEVIWRPLLKRPLRDPLAA